MLHDLSKLSTCYDKKRGYEVAYYPSHPNASTSGLVYVHRLVMENSLNRFLINDEIVHHKDKNKSNNNIKNLELMTNAEHSKHHSPGDAIIGTLRVCLACQKEYTVITRNQKLCSMNCKRKNEEKIEWPSIELILKKLETMPMTTLAKELGVSDNAIRHRLKRRSIYV